jgi:lysophospholipase L1-like esterase
MRFAELPAEIQEKAAGDWGLQDPLQPLPGFFPEDPDEWMSRHIRFVDAARAGGVRVLFIGDSITEGWGGEGADTWAKNFAPLCAANFGIGGDRTQQILWRIQNGTLECIEPEVVVLLIGVNNLWMMSHSAEQVAAGIFAVTSEIQHRLPNVKILLQGILPTGEAADHPLRGIIADINAMLAAKDFGDQVRYFDFGSLFLEPDGTILATTMPDFCHLSAEAYANWGEALVVPLNELLAD